MPKNSIFTIDSPETFEIEALKTFRSQYENVIVYRNFCKALKKDPSSVKKLTDIPFLPIEFFKTHTVLDSTKESQKTFTSSGTTGTTTSKHYVADIELYELSFQKAFEHFFGTAEELIILGLLPSYFDQDSSSLLYMVDKLMQKNKGGGFFLDDIPGLIRSINELENTGKKALLIGVSFALLDLIEQHSFDLKNIMVMETGGMKGRRKELIRADLHKQLKRGFGVAEIYSEYGMTELLSQAYSQGDGLFNCPPWMKILTRDTEDALTFVSGKTGGINVIDLANRYSCSFLATQDLGRIQPDGSFEILGRFDTSDIRGCNLMVL